jgi:DNA-binding NarL/FixJ family response regulator
MAHLALSIVALRRGDVDEARILQRRAREAGGTPRETTITYNHEAATLMHAGLFREGLAVARQGEAYATAHGLHRNVGCFLTGNVGDLLYELGRWDEVERLVAEQLRDDINEWARSWFLLLKAQVAVARGSPAVRTHLAEAMATTRHFDSPQEVAPLLVAYAEHLLSAGEPYAARPRAARAYALASEALLQRTRALWVMLRIEGDIASLGALGRAEVPVSVEDEARSLSQRAMPAEVAYGALCEAELTRVAGRPDPLLWAVAAERLDGLESPYRSAYARFRQSEAMLVSGRTRGDDVATILQTAHRIALDLGAAPLVAEITALALRGRILLGSMQHQGGGVSDPLAEYSLSDREVEVLRLLAAGMTNREIGSALFISPKTASVHVSHILAKLQVRSRVQAAGIAHRLGVIAAER